MLVQGYEKKYYSYGRNTIIMIKIIHKIALYNDKKKDLFYFILILFIFQAKSQLNSELEKSESARLFYKSKTFTENSFQNCMYNNYLIYIFSKRLYTFRKNKFNKNKNK